ncbi:hypothetical protein J6590_103044 [Homalodisca vitripennis]|nr:hypothetical protein J6590_103044 [Homalodisca vitripennis]
MHPAGPSPSFHWPKLEDICPVPIPHVMAPIYKNRMEKCRAQKKANPDTWKDHLKKDMERKNAQRDIMKQERRSNPKMMEEYERKTS